MKLQVHAAFLAAAFASVGVPLQAEWGWLAGKVGGGYTKPVNAINSRIKGGYNMNGGLGVNLGPYLTFMGEYTLMENGFTDQFKSRNSIPGGSIRVHAVTVSPIIRFGGDRRVSPYVTGGFGWYRRTVELTRPTTQLVTIFDPFFGVFFPAEVPVNQILSSYTVNKGGWNAGAGLDFKFGDSRAKLFAEARYHYIGTRAVATELLPFTVGVRW